MSTDNKQSGFKRILIAIIVAALAMAAGIWAARAVLEHNSVQDELDATRFPEAREIVRRGMLWASGELSVSDPS